MPKIVYSVSTKQDKAIKGFLQLDQSINKTTQSFKRSKRSGISLTGAIAKLGVGTLTATAFLRTYNTVQAKFDTVTSQSAKSLVGFSASIRELLALGEGTKNIRGISEAVLKEMEKLGVSFAPISKAKFRIKSGLSEFPEDIQKQVFDRAALNFELTASPLADEVKSLISSFRAFGDSMSVAELAALNFITAEKALIEPQEFAQNFPKIAKAFAKAGEDARTAAVAVMVGTGSALEPTQVLTQLRNLVIILDTLEKEGKLKPTGGDFFKQVQQFKGIESATASASVGQRNVVTLLELADNTKRFREELEALRIIPIDIVRNRLVKLYSDPAEAAAAMARQAESAAEAGFLRFAQTPQQLKKINIRSLVTRGAPILKRKLSESGNIFDRFASTFIDQDDPAKSLTPGFFKGVSFFEGLGNMRPPINALGKPSPGEFLGMRREAVGFGFGNLVQSQQGRGAAGQLLIGQAKEAIIVEFGPKSFELMMKNNALQEANLARAQEAATAR